MKPISRADCNIRTTQSTLPASGSVRGRSAWRGSSPRTSPRKRGTWSSSAARRRRGRGPCCPGHKSGTRRATRRPSTCRVTRRCPGPASTLPPGSALTIPSYPRHPVRHVARLPRRLRLHEHAWTREPPRALQPDRVAEPERPRYAARLLARRHETPERPLRLRAVVLSPVSISPTSRRTVFAARTAVPNPNPPASNTLNAYSPRPGTHLPPARDHAAARTSTARG